MAIAATGLIAWHAFKVRRDGGISHRPREAGKPKPQRIHRRELLRREGIAMLVTSALLLLLSLLFDAPLGAAVPPCKGSTAAQAPWFFMWVQALLRLLPPLVAGVAIPLLAVLLLASLPWLLDRKTEGVAQ